MKRPKKATPLSPDEFGEARDEWYTGLNHMIGLFQAARREGNQDRARDLWETYRWMKAQVRELEAEHEMRQAATTGVS
jgi:hypothetical protein